VLDERNNILFINPAARHTFGTGDRSDRRPLVDAIPHPDLRSLLARSSTEPLKYHEIRLDAGGVLNAQFTPIPGIGSAITMQDISYLKEVDRLKSDFVQTISHDLRSPLTSLIGYADLVRRIGPLTDEQLEFMNRMKASYQQITVLVDDLLNLRRLETGFETRLRSVFRC
jgi:two-component system NtrC family sensor kinase